MPYLRLDNLSLSYGTLQLLDRVSMELNAGDKIGLLGVNGAGKSSLLKIIEGAIQADTGERWLDAGVKLACLDQTLPAADERNVFDVVAGGLQDVGDLLTRYHQLAQSSAVADLDALERVQQQLEAKDGWSLQQRVNTVLSQLQLDPEQPMSALSGGWRRRVALAQALVNDPDILLLDEPTNHLDIPAIEWLEQLLRDYRAALVFVTHDRAFLQRIANRIVELDRGRLSSWRGDYQGFIRFREQQLAAEAEANRQFDKKLAQEEVWIRQGIKARRTRNEGRVRGLKAMRAERLQRRERSGSASFSLDASERSGKVVAELHDVSFAYQDLQVIRNFSSVIMRGDRVGIIGANGAGKSTLIKLILGQLAPTSGQVKLGTKLEIAYFDQLRETLDPDKTLQENICGGRDFIDIAGKSRHAISYLSDFLFSPERARAPVKALSGGEQNRAILAKLFSKPANVLVLDEPTNDLDVETLELLEEILLAFKGTVLLVSHDRSFMDNVVTSVMVLEGDGSVTESVGGYTDWVAHGGKLKPLDMAEPANNIGVGAEKSQASDSADKAKPGRTPTRKKLSYKEQREIDQLPDLIESLEQQQQNWENQIADPGFYQGDHVEVNATLAQLAQVQEQLESAYQRWQELDAKLLP